MYEVIGRDHGSQPLARACPALRADILAQHLALVEQQLIIAPVVTVLGWKESGWSWGSIAVATMVTIDWGCCTHGLKKLRMYTNPPLRSNTLLPSLGLSTGSLGAATPPRTLPPRFRSVCDRRAVPGAPDWGDVEGYPLAGGEDAAALVNGALLGVASRRGAAGGVHPSHTCLCCSPSLPAAWLTAARRAGALRAAPRGPRRRVPPRHASLAVAARGARDASAVDGPAGATRAAEVAMVPPIMSKCAQAPTLQRPLVRTSSMPRVPLRLYGVSSPKIHVARVGFPSTTRETRVFPVPSRFERRSRRYRENPHVANPRSLTCPWRAPSWLPPRARVEDKKREEGSWDPVTVPPYNRIGQ